MNKQVIIKTNYGISLLVSLLMIVVLSQCKAVEKESLIVEVPIEPVELKVLPSSTDKSITNTDVAHYIKYNPSIESNRLLLFLPGTNGIPERGPKRLFDAAIEAGYSVINLSYINKQAVARICKGENLKNDSDCTEKFRQQRIFGSQLIKLIPDQPQDAIMNRFVKLLLYLTEHDPGGNWGKFLEGHQPKWEMITVSGQSQGGGMAAFIAKSINVERIITFSGGWDYQEVGKIAEWYADPSVTPLDRWYGVYHEREPMASVIATSYEAMSIPLDQTFALDKKVREGRKAHGEGIRNIIYQEMWKDLFHFD